MIPSDFPGSSLLLDLRQFPLAPGSVEHRRPLVCLLHDRRAPATHASEIGETIQLPDSSDEWRVVRDTKITVRPPAPKPVPFERIHLTKEN